MLNEYVGTALGDNSTKGEAVGLSVGNSVGDKGESVGDSEGAAVTGAPLVCVKVGISDGAKLGLSVGDSV